MVSIDDFAKMDIRVGTVTSAGPHPNADKLIVLNVDLGEPEARQLVAGLKQWYSPEDLIGKQIVVLANLEPAKLRGVESQGMLLAASDNAGVAVLTLNRQTAPGSKVS